jgi:hypothetical protein
MSGASYRDDMNPLFVESVFEEMREDADDLDAFVLRILAEVLPPSEWEPLMQQARDEKPRRPPLQVLLRYLLEWTRSARPVVEAWYREQAAAGRRR